MHIWVSYERPNLAQFNAEPVCYLEKCKDNEKFNDVYALNIKKLPVMFKKLQSEAQPKWFVTFSRFYFFS